MSLSRALLTDAPPPPGALPVGGVPPGNPPGGAPVGGMPPGNAPRVRPVLPGVPMPPIPLPATAGPAEGTDPVCGVAAVSSAYAAEPPVRVTAPATSAATTRGRRSTGTSARPAATAPATRTSQPTQGGNEGVGWSGG